jgi:hypothetical protein
MALPPRSMRADQPDGIRIENTSALSPIVHFKCLHHLAILKAVFLSLLCQRCILAIAITPLRHNLRAELEGMCAVTPYKQMGEVSVVVQMKQHMNKFQHIGGLTDLAPFDQCKCLLCSRLGYMAKDSFHAAHKL